MRVLVYVIVCVWVSISACAAEPASLLRSTTDFGGIGLMQIPTACFGADGNMRLGICSGRGHAGLVWRPVTRDGGQRLAVGERLYGGLESACHGARLAPRVRLSKKLRTGSSS